MRLTEVMQEALCNWRLADTARFCAQILVRQVVGCLSGFHNGLVWLMEYLEIFFPWIVLSPKRLSLNSVDAKKDEYV
jgi:hypothetical protein